MEYNSVVKALVESKIFKYAISHADMTTIFCQNDRMLHGSKSTLKLEVIDMLRQTSFFLTIIMIGVVFLGTVNQGFVSVTFLDSGSSSAVAADSGRIVETVPITPDNESHSLTPFNFTTTLMWEPWMAEPPGRLEHVGAITNESVRARTGWIQRFYMTLLPMAPHVTRVNYTISVEHLEGPSNVSIVLGVKLHVGERGRISSGTFTTDISSTIEAPTMNTSQQYVMSSSLTVNSSHIWFYSYDYVRQNLTMERGYAYSAFYVVPFPESPDLYWNHTLFLKLSVAGWEDRGFFNELRVAKGLPPWNDTQFTPFSQEVTCCTTNDGNRLIQFGPMHQDSVAATSTEERVAWAFTEPPNESIMMLNASAQTSISTDVNLRLAFTRIYLGNGFKLTSSINVDVQFQGGYLDASILVNWDALKNRSVNFGEVGEVVSYYQVGVLMTSLTGSWDAWSNITMASPAWRPDTGDVELVEVIVTAPTSSSPADEHANENNTITSSSTLGSGGDNVREQPNAIIPLEVFSIPVLVGMAVLFIVRRKYKFTGKIR